MSRAPRRRRERVRAPLVIGVAAALALSGCAGLPTTSAVAPGKAVGARSDSEPLAVEPLTAGAFSDPRQIASGFLRAQMSSHDGYAAARTFLAPGAASEWKPGDSVTVFDGGSDITATRPDTNSVRLSVPVVGTLTADGRLSRSATATRRTLEFHVTDTASGWRIDRVPSSLGVWMSDTDLARLYTSATVYYPGAQGHTLIPDPRLLPRQGLATALARAALAPAPSWLAPAVAPAMPTGTTLAVDAVPVRNGAADVTLSKAVAGADNAARAALWASVTATVMQAPDVRSVTLRVGGARLETENLPATVTAPGQVGYSIAPGTLDAVVSRSGTYLAWTLALASDAVRGTNAQAAADRPHLPAVPSDWPLVAVGQGGRQIAAVSQDHTSVRRWLNGTDVTIGSIGAGLVRPSFDNSGWLWIAGHTFSNATGPGAGAGEKRGSVWAVDTNAAADEQATRHVSVPWLGSASIASVSLSPEGARALLTVVDGKRRHAVVAAVERDAQGHPVALGPAHDVAVGVDDVADATWADATSVAVLGTVDGTFQPAVATIDDVLVPLGPVPSATGLVSTLNGASGLFVRTDRRTVYTRLGSSWSSFLTNGDVLAPRS